MIQSSSSCTLPPISDLFPLPRWSSNFSKSSMNQHHRITINTTTTSINTEDVLVNTTSTANDYHHHHYERNSQNNKTLGYYRQLKAKRKRASPSQLSILNQVFSQTYFPSTELRIELGKRLGMSPRTVQIWFQNKRQSLRSRTRRYSFSSMESGEIEVEEEENITSIYYAQCNQNGNMTGSPPPWTPTPNSNAAAGNDHDYFILPPPSSASGSGSSSPVSSSSSPVMKNDDHYYRPQHPHQKVNLPPLRSSYYPPSPPSSTYSSPISIGSILH